MSVRVTNDVQICNLALGVLNISDSPVSNIENPLKDPDITCSKYYAQVRREVLEKNHFNASIKRSVRSRDVNVPLFQFSDAYNLPNDYLKILGIYHENYGVRTLSEEDYSDENGQILLNNNGASSIKLIYIFDQKDITKWPPSLIKYFYLALAADMCMEVTGSEKLESKVEEKRDRALLNSRSIDGMKRPPKVIDGSPLTDRFNSHGFVGQDGYIYW